MNRRQAIGNATALLGTLVLSPTLFTSCESKGGKNDSKGYVVDQIAMLDEISDAMLPTTSDSPGAKAAGCGAVMNQILVDCFTPEENEAFTGLMHGINQSSNDKFDRSFEKLTHDEKVQ